MCGTGDAYGLIHDARVAADEILERYFRLPVQKAYDLGTPRGFDRAVLDLSRRLKATVSSSEQEAIRAAIEVLDVDWSKTTAGERRALFAQSMRAAGLKTAGIPRLTEVVFGGAADDLVAATRQSVRRDQRLKISADFNARDKRITKHLATSNSYFTSDEYGRRSQAFGRQAAQIVSEGLESGLGQKAIARDLERAAANTIAGRGSNYWDVIAGAFVGRGRSYSQLSAYREANIARYVFEAVLDEVTTETCRFFHGKVFSVDRGIQLFEQVEKNPENIKELTPWVRSGLDEEGSSVLFVKKGDQRIPIATVGRSGFGIKDDVGTFRNTRSEQELMDMHLSFPPLHGLCRSCLSIG